YRRLGLLTNLNGKAAGGVEKLYPDEKPVEIPESEREPIDLSKLTEEEIEELKKTLRPDEGLIQRDDEGNIIRIITGERQSHDDILDAPIVLVEAKTDFVRQLEAQAANVHVGERYTTDSEARWLEKLIKKHGDDYDAMFWDTELNVNQLTATQ
ncbi:ribosome biogenesis protein Nop16, partial [Cunninghamella echinulata]